MPSRKLICMMMDFWGVAPSQNLFSKVRLSIMCLWNPNFKIGGTSFKWALFLSGMTLLYAGREWVVQVHRTAADRRWLCCSRNANTLYVSCWSFSWPTFISMFWSEHFQTRLRPSIDIWKTAFRTTGQQIFKQKNTHSLLFYYSTREIEKASCMSHCVWFLKQAYSKGNFFCEKGKMKMNFESE